ncbi:hypothetical protein GJQ54_05435 [Oceanospirillaceae bacterium ASx5O]|nr:hypothetical protein GJQ54_05435 [Oceanospirillaceae bacterium ASx5O]
MSYQIGLKSCTDIQLNNMVLICQKKSPEALQRPEAVSKNIGRELDVSSVTQWKNATEEASVVAITSNGVLVMVERGGGQSVIEVSFDDLDDTHPLVPDRFSFRLGVLAGVRAAGG